VTGHYTPVKRRLDHPVLHVTTRL